MTKVKEIVGRLRESDILRPTAAGLLMFGEEYRIVRYFPEYPGQAL